MRGGEPVSIGKLLAEVLARRGLAGALRAQPLRDAYARVAGPELAGRTRVASVRGGVVTIETDSQALAFELQGFLARKLVAELQKQPGAEFVTKLKFQAGAATNGR